MSHLFSRTFTLLSFTFSSALLLGQSQPGWGWEGVYRIQPPSGSGAFAAEIDGGVDFNNDGHPDLLIGDPARSEVYLHSGLDGSLLLRVSSTFPTFGDSVAGVGDLNGDQVPDFFVGAPQATVSGLSLAGAVLACSGLDGTVLWQIDGQEQDARFGWAICALSDVTGDGISELAVGIPYSDHSGFTDCGTVKVYSGSSGSLVQDLTPLIFGGDGLTAGFSLAAVGDVNGDGWEDLLIGGPSQSSWSGDGKVFLVSGGTWVRLHIFGGWSFGPSFGLDLAGARDVDGDGILDLAIAQPRKRSGPPGWVYIYNAEPPYAEIALVSPSTSLGWSYFGKSIDISDDLDGDSLADLIIGVPNSGLSPGNVVCYSPARAESFAVFGGTTSSSRLGEQVLAGGDLDGDGHPEILVCGASLYEVPAVIGFRPFLELTSEELSASLGGTVDLKVNFPKQARGRIYRTLASLSGTGPIAAGRIEIPLTMDSLFLQTWLGQYPTFASGLSGSLDPRGDARGVISPGPNALSASLVGSTLFLAVIAEWPGVIYNCSFAETIQIVP